MSLFYSVKIFKGYKQIIMLFYIIDSITGVGHRSCVVFSIFKLSQDSHLLN